MTASEMLGEVCAAVESAEGFAFGKIWGDVFPEDEGDAVCARMESAPAAERKFLDGTSLEKWAIAFFVRSSDASAARDGAKGIADALDALSLKAEDGTEVFCETESLPLFVETDEKNNTVYSVAVSAECLKSQS